MKIIAIAGVMAGGKTTTVNALLKKLPNSQALYFDNYDIKGEISDFDKWVADGADWNIYDVTPLEKDIITIRNSGNCEYLLLDYPLAYRNNTLGKYLILHFTLTHLLIQRLRDMFFVI